MTAPWTPTLAEARAIVAKWLAEGADEYLDPSANGEVMQSLRVEREALLALLRSVQWKGPTDGEFKHPVAHTCPACGHRNLLGHGPDCPLAAFLREG